MLSLPPSCMASVWDCPSAAPSWNRMAAACGLPTILRAAQAFVSPFPPKARPMNDTRRRSRGIRPVLSEGQLGSYGHQHSFFAKDMDIGANFGSVLRTVGIGQPGTRDV